MRLDGVVQFAVDALIPLESLDLPNLHLYRSLFALFLQLLLRADHALDYLCHQTARLLWFLESSAHDRLLPPLRRPSPRLPLPLRRWGLRQLGHHQVRLAALLARLVLIFDTACRGIWQHTARLDSSEGRPLGGREGAVEGEVRATVGSLEGGQGGAEGRVEVVGCGGGREDWGE